ncbi:MAG: AAA family ATPase [Paucibacter sp.]|nr:AAA family ATPase [Roseateles sp.]
MEEKRPLHVHFADFVIDEAEARLERSAQTVELAPRAFQVLCELIRRAGQLVTKDVLLDAVWGHRHINEAALKNIVSQLRNALGDDARESVYIQTVSRRGYRFIAPIAQVAPVPVSAVPASGARSVPAPAPMAGDLIVGRQVLLARVQEAAMAACQGHRQVVFLVGEAGIGKSTLVERIVRQAHMAVAFGQCIEHYGEVEPYMPVLEALNNLCRMPEGTAVLPLLRRVAPSWLMQLPWFLTDAERVELQREVAGATQDRMLREFGEFVDRLAAEHPLLLVLEDLHWSDHATVLLLDYLARRRSSSSLLVLGTLRPTELILKEHPLAMVRHELRLRRLCLDLELEYLSESELAAYLAARVGRTPPEDFVRQLHAKTSGLPLFVAAVVDDLLTSGRLAPSEGNWQVPAQESAVPRGIADVVETQLARLSAEQQRLLGAASVGGLDFSHLALAAVLDMDGEVVHVHLQDAAARLPWLSDSGVAAQADGQLAAGYRFTHAIYRQVVYARLQPLQRLQWHRGWADMLSKTHAANLPDIAAELALHFERGEAPLEAAAQLAVVSARAMTFGAPRDALHAARHGLALAAGRLEPARELELRVGEAVALTRMVVITAPEVRAAFERALALGPLDGPAWQSALHGAWWAAYSRGDLGAARSFAAQMQALAESRDDAALRQAGLIASGMIQMLSGEFVSARRNLGRALELSAKVAAEQPPTCFVLDPVVEATEGLALVCWIGGEPRLARQLAAQAVALAAANRHPLSEVTALYAASILHALAGEFGTVHSLTERLYSITDEHELPARRGGFAWLHGQALVAFERADAGLGEMRDAALAAQELGMRTGLCGFHYHYAVACRQAGRDTEAAESVEAGLTLSAELGDTMLLSALLLMRAQAALQEGERVLASSTLEQAITTARRQGAVLFELQALAFAEAQGLPGGDRSRKAALLDLYRDDPSPLIEALRATATTGAD